jgi:proton-dependent oligopeptide transporter, POT family
VWMAVGVVSVVVALLMFNVIPFNPLLVAQNSAWVITALAIVVFIYLFLFTGIDVVGRRRLLVILVLFAASAIFWAGFEQAGSSFNLFASRYTDRMIATFNFEIPTGWFQSVNTFLILVCAPLFAALWQALSARNREWMLATKMALGLLFLAVGFVVIAGAAHFVAQGMKVAPFWLIATYLFHTFGELCLSPVGQSAFSKLVPPRLVGQIMGLWFLSISLGNLLAGLIAGDFDPNNLGAMPGQFMNIVWFAVVPGVVLLLLAKPLQKLAGGVR